MIIQVPPARISCGEGANTAIASRRGGNGTQRKFEDALELIGGVESEAELEAGQIETLSARLSELEGMLQNQESDLAVERTSDGLKVKVVYVVEYMGAL